MKCPNCENVDGYTVDCIESNLTTYFLDENGDVHDSKHVSTVETKYVGNVRCDTCEHVGTLAEFGYSNGNENG